MCIRDSLGGEHGELLSEVMLEVFRELYDPNSQGFLGPRFERIYSQAIAALRILFGDRASLAAIPFVIRDQKQVSELAEAVGTVDPALKSTLISDCATTTSPRSRVGSMRSSTGWSRVQRCVPFSAPATTRSTSPRSWMSAAFS